MKLPEKLYHYTCEHGHAALKEAGTLKPGPDGFVWMTDLVWPIAKALGLTQNILPCDRTQHRYEVDGREDVFAWVDIRSSVDQELVFQLELAPGAMPMHWYLALGPVPAHYDPIRR